MQSRFILSKIVDSFIFEIFNLTINYLKMMDMINLFSFSKINLE